MTNELGFTNNAIQKAPTEMAAEARAVAEVQAAYVIAKKFPRNEAESFSRIMTACKRPTLAEQAHYAFPKGGNMVTGESIRLAEVMAQSWGNIDFGVRELSQANGISVVEVYAIDLETNAQCRRTLHIPHVRDTKKGRIKLTDAREIYLEVANQSARRLRDCIFKILPGDLIDAASEQCKATLLTSDEPMVDRVRKMVMKFDEYGVKVEHLEKRLGHNLDAIIPQEIVTLTAIYKSLRDGMAKREAFFDMGKPPVGSAEEKLDEIMNGAKEKIDVNTGEITENGENEKK